MRERRIACKPSFSGLVSARKHIWWGIPRSSCKSPVPTAAPDTPSIRRRSARPAAPSSASAATIAGSRSSTRRRRPTLAVGRAARAGRRRSRRRHPATDAGQRPAGRRPHRPGEKLGHLDCRRDRLRRAVRRRGLRLSRRDQARACPLRWRTVLHLDAAARDTTARAQVGIDMAATKIDLVDGRYVVQGELVNTGTAPGSTEPAEARLPGRRAGPGRARPAAGRGTDRAGRAHELQPAA